MPAHFTPGFFAPLLVILSGLACQPASFQAISDEQVQQSNDSEDARGLSTEGDQLVVAEVLTASITPSTTEELPAVETPKTPTEPKAPETSKDIMLACAAAQKEGKLVEMQKTLLFPKTEQACNFGQNDNLTPKDQYVRARFEQGMAIELTDVKRLCGLKLDVPQQKMKYDDEMLLLLNDIVLAASQNYSQKVLDYDGKPYFPAGLAVDTEGHVSYKWAEPNGLRGLPYLNVKIPRYCLGLDPKSADFDQKCQIPKTDTTGAMKLELPQEAVIKMAVKAGIKFDDVLKQAPVARFAFVTTGDNDYSDCQHQDLKITVTFSYIKK
jgi:hypothetical protein